MIYDPNPFVQKNESGLVTQPLYIGMRATVWLQRQIIKRYCKIGRDIHSSSTTSVISKRMRISKGKSHISFRARS